MTTWIKSDLVSLTRNHQPAVVFAVFAISICLVTVNLSVAASPAQQAAATDKSLMMFMQWIPLFALAAWAIANIKEPLFALQLRGNPAWWGVLVFCAASALWSDLPGTVIKRSLQNVGMLWIILATAWYFHSRMTFFYGKLLWMMGLLVWLSLMAAVFMPQLGIERAPGIEGTWRGIIGQKNLLGIFCALTLYWCAVCWHQKVIGSNMAVLVCLPALTCLLMSRSSTSAMLTVASVSSYFFLVGVRVRSNSLVLRSVLLALMFAVTVVLGHYFVETELPSSQIFIEPISAFFGKESHLTGRSDIWEIMWGLIAQHPILGMGYASFWLGPGGPSQFVSDLLLWQVPTAHNGYLEILNEVGIVGMLLFISALLWHVANLARLSVHNRPLAASHIGILVIFLISNFSESTALRLFEYLQISLATSMCMAVFQLHSALQKARAVG